ncbi:hypothetical protein LPN04_31325 [Rugamonas sp. A1-17]|nr:hypothetical protein [Rugamonas sp. A1-17]
MHKLNEPTELLLDPVVAQASISATRRLEAYLSAIEESMASGVPRRVILEYLNANGFQLSMASFATMLKRIRKRKTAQPKDPTPQEKAVSTPAVRENVSRPILATETRKFNYDAHSNVGWTRAKT